VQRTPCFIDADLPLLFASAADGKERSSRIGTIAAELGVSRRTLARRLGAEGLTFRKLMDDLRFDLAKRYLREQDLLR
jgi:AraC-like DNA-binding protein